MNAIAVPNPETSNMRFRLSPFLTKSTPIITPSNPAIATITAAPRTGSNSKPIRFLAIDSSSEL